MEKTTERVYAAEDEHALLNIVAYQTPAITTLMQYENQTKTKDRLIILVAILFQTSLL